MNYEMQSLGCHSRNGSSVIRSSESKSSPSNEVQ